MLQHLALFGATMLASTVSAVQKFSIPLPEPIVLDQPVGISDIPQGFKASIELASVRQAGNVWFDTIIQVVNGLKIPDFTSGKDYMKDNTFYIEQRVDGVTLEADTANNAIKLNCNRLTAKFRCNNFRYKIAPLMVANGYVEVDMNQVDIGFGLQFKTQIAPSGRQIMMVDSVDIVVDINRDDIKLHIGGGFWTDLASIFKVFFKGTVVNLIRDSVTAALQTTIPAVTNAALIKNDGYFSYIPNWVMDWESPTAAIVTSDTWNLAVKGLMFDSRIGEITPNVTIPAMPYKDITKPAQVQGFVSTWAIDAFFQSGLSISPIGGWYNATETNGTWSLTTESVSAMLPGIVEAYGDQPVNLHFKLLQVTDVQITENDQNMGALFTLDLDFYVLNNATNTFTEAASITLQDTDFAFTALINDMTLAMQINTINVDKVVTNYCSWGKLSALVLKTKLNAAFLVAKPIVNQILATHDFKVPSHLGKYFILSDLTIGYYNNFLFIGLTPTFVGPSTATKEWYIQEARRALPPVTKDIKVTFK